MYRDLQSFVAALESAGELVRITDRVDPILEVSQIADRVSKAEAPHPPSQSARGNDPAFANLGGPALLFENVAGSDVPLLINAFGSYRRMEMALGCEAGGFDAIGRHIGELVKPQPPRSLSEAIAKARQFAPLLKIGPRRRRGRGPCQEVVRTGDDIDLTKLPLIRCWPHDGDFASLGYPANVNADVPHLGHPDITDEEWNANYRGRYITLAGIHTIHADDRDAEKPASHNIGMYRVQLFGKDRLSMHWHMHHDGASHWRSWKKLGRPMPVAIVLGGEAVLPYAATAPLPPGISELLMAGYLNKSGIPLVRGVSVPLWIPANAEIVIEGYVRTDAGLIDFDPEKDPVGDGAVFEGPFGDHTGFYSLPDRYPIVEVSAVTTRKQPIYPTTVVGLPPQEDYFLGKATERLFLPLLKVLVPDIIDYDLPMFGAFHNCAFIQISKHYPMHARRVMHAIWGAGQMAWTKSIFVVDETVDVHDTAAVLRACAERCHPIRDVEFVHGALDILDHAAPYLGAGVKIGFDCTRKIKGEETNGFGVNITDDVAAGKGAIDRAALASYVREAAGVRGVLEAVAPDFAPGWVFLRCDRSYNEPHSAGLGREILDAAIALTDAPRYLVALGRDTELSNPVDPLFHWLANADPGRDAIRGHGVLAFDSTPKTREDSSEAGPVRKWPPVVGMTAEVGRSATERARSWGLQPPAAS